MSYETVTLATKVYTRRVQRDDSATLVAEDSTIGVPIQMELKRTLPQQASSMKVVRGRIRTTHSYKDTVSGKVYPVIFDVQSSIPVEVPSATVAAALDRFQAAIATEALATDVLTNGVVY